MSKEQPSKSHAVAWALSVLAVPVLYLLSVPPLWLLVPDTSTPNYKPEWARKYCAPYVQLRENTPYLYLVLDTYSHWWGRLLGRES